MQPQARYTTRVGPVGLPAEACQICLREIHWNAGYSCIDMLEGS